MTIKNIIKSIPNGYLILIHSKKKNLLMASKEPSFILDFYSNTRIFSLQADENNKTFIITLDR